MAFSDRAYVRRSISSLFPRGVQWLIVANVAIYAIYAIAARTGYGQFFEYLALMPAAVVQLFWIWQPFTYLFLHDPMGFKHIFFNMFSLWVFGRMLEEAWGTRKFLEFYFVSGVGAGICVIVANYAVGTPASITIGASGAIYGCMLAAAMLFPDQMILFDFLFPIKLKYFAMIMGGIAFLSSFDATGTNVSHFAHLGGMLWAWGYLKYKAKQRRRTPVRGRTSPGSGAGFWSGLRQQYREWRIQRARRKFDVYLRKQDSDRDRRVN